MHYALSMRTDNPYWRWCTQRNMWLEEQMDMNVRVTDNYERLGSSLDFNVPIDANMNGMTYIAAGMGMKLGREWLDERNPDELEFVVDSHREYEKEVYDFVSSDECPSHYDYLKEYIYGGDELRAEFI